MKSKLHRATVTESDLHYEGSVSIDKDLLNKANIIEYEQVNIYNITNGERFTTYALEGKENSGIICINGAAAKKASKGDKVIIVTYTCVEENEINGWKPKCILLDDYNKIKKIVD